MCQLTHVLDSHVASRLRPKCNRDGDITGCQGCPRTFHESCLPAGHVLLPTDYDRQGDGAGIPFLCDLCASVGDQFGNIEPRLR